MFTKTTTKDGRRVVEYYEHWHETFRSQTGEAGMFFLMGFWYVLLGVVFLVSSPLVAIYKMWRPTSLGGKMEESPSWRNSQK